MCSEETRAETQGSDKRYTRFFSTHVRFFQHIQLSRCSSEEVAGQPLVSGLLALFREHDSMSESGEKKTRYAARRESVEREGGEWGARRPREPAVGPILR